MAAKPAEQKNVLGTALQVCSVAPLTGFFRDGYCRTSVQDRGEHIAAAQVTQEVRGEDRSLLAELGVSCW